MVGVGESLSDAPGLGLDEPELVDVVPGDCVIDVAGALTGGVADIVAVALGLRVALELRAGGPLDT